MGGTSWEMLAVAFLGGSLMAAAISAFVKHWIFHPVISVCLDKECTGRVPLGWVDPTTKQWKHSHDVRYFRLRIENTGLSSIRDCCGLIVGLTKRTDKAQTVPPQEVIYLGWAHYDKSKTRDIPRGAYFYMDVVTLDLFNPIRKLRLSAETPGTLFGFFDDKATYEFKILLAADNAKPRRNLTVTIEYDPNSDDLKYAPLDARKFPWWARRRWLCSKLRKL